MLTNTGCNLSVVSL